MIKQSILPSNAKPGTWVYKVDEGSAVLCFVASWKDAEVILIEIHETEARQSQNRGFLYPVSELDIVPDYLSARSGLPLRSGMVCATQTKGLLIYTLENGQLSEADIMTGESPENASGAISFVKWDLVSFGVSGARVLASVSL